MACPLLWVAIIKVGKATENKKLRLVRYNASSKLLYTSEIWLFTRFASADEAVQGQSHRYLYKSNTDDW